MSEQKDKIKLYEEKRVRYESVTNCYQLFEKSTGKPVASKLNAKSLGQIVPAEIDSHSIVSKMEIVEQEGDGDE